MYHLQSSLFIYLLRRRKQNKEKVLLRRKYGTGYLKLQEQEAVQRLFALNTLDFEAAAARGQLEHTLYIVRSYLLMGLVLIIAGIVGTPRTTLIKKNKKKLLLENWLNL